MNTSETKFFSRKCYLLKKLSVNFFSEIILEIMKMEPSSSTVGWLRETLKEPYANFKKTLCPKNVWMRHCTASVHK